MILMTVAFSGQLWLSFPINTAKSQHQPRHQLGNYLALHKFLAVATKDFSLKKRNEILVDKILVITGLRMGSVSNFAWI